MQLQQEEIKEGFKTLKMKVNCFRSISRLIPTGLFAAFLCMPVVIVRATNSATPSAQPDDGVVILYSSLPGGINREQTLVLTVMNPLLPGSRMKVQVRLHDALGNVIAERAEQEVAPGGFRSVEFSRADIPIVGDPDTGRIVVGATIAFRMSSARNLPEDVPVSTEHIDDLTGTTTRSEAKANLKAIYTAEKAY